MTKLDRHVCGDVGAHGERGQPAYTRIHLTTTVTTSARIFALRFISLHYDKLFRFISIIIFYIESVGKNNKLIHFLCFLHKDFSFLPIFLFLHRFTSCRFLRLGETEVMFTLKEEISYPGQYHCDVGEIYDTVKLKVIVAVS